MEPKLSGSYTTSRDGGIRYAYDAFWTQVDKTIKWDAKVRRDGEVVGNPGGVINEVPRNTNIDALVRTNVETSIEARDKVES